MPPSSSEDFRVLKVDARKGVGLFAARRFAAGEAIYRLDYWSEEQMPIHATNHSCDPNARFDEGGMLVALREIGPGEEITFDYVATPLPASPWNFECVCGSEGCVGWVDVRKVKESDDVQPP